MKPFGLRHVTTRHAPIEYFQHFWSKDKTPITALLLSSIVGVVIGLIGTYFQKAVYLVSETRTDWLKDQIGSTLPLWFFAFIISATLAFIGYYLVHRFAPEAAGSGVHEVEGAMAGVRTLRWWRVLPVKFFGGIGALGSGMVLGMGGPTIQMGGCVGRMIGDIFKVKSHDAKHSLIAAGAAGGLSAIFNAPLAGIMFVIEEMRPQFRYSIISIRAVVLSAITANIVFRSINGQQALITMPVYSDPELSTLWLFLVLGMLFGIFGVAFNRMITLSQDLFARLHRNDRKRYLITGSLLGGCFGLLLLYMPEVTGGGIDLIPSTTNGEFGAKFLLLLFVARIATAMICFGSGAPGGIFAPMLAFGTLFGYAFGIIAQGALPSFDISPGMFAIAGMGALFAATVRAPITGILLVIELTNNYYMILPLLVTSLAAAIFSQLFGGKPIYSQMLHRTLKNQKLKQEDLPASTEAK
jgi:CIC family chloride channel protein